MGKWAESLPERRSHGPWKDDYAASALESIAIAMAHGAEPSQCLDSIRDAAVEVRAWRKSLPRGLRGTRAVAGLESTPRECLRSAARSVLTADGSHTQGYAAINMRQAEAYLREGARLIEKGE